MGTRNSEDVLDAASRLTDDAFLNDLRQKKRLINVSDLLRKDDEDGDILALFDQKGMWRLDERPADWGDPEVTPTRKRFLFTSEPDTPNSVLPR